MKKYNDVEELETIAKAAQEMPGFVRLMNLCAWSYSVYDRARIDCNRYIDEHPTHRPTKERERLQAQCSRMFGEYAALIEALGIIAEDFGYVTSRTISSEILEMTDGYDTIRRRRELLLKAHGNA